MLCPCPPRKAAAGALLYKEKLLFLWMVQNYFLSLQALSNIISVWNQKLEIE